MEINLLSAGISWVYFFLQRGGHLTPALLPQQEFGRGYLDTDWLGDHIHGDNHLLSQLLSHLITPVAIKFPTASKIQAQLRIFPNGNIKLKQISSISKADGHPVTSFNTTKKDQIHTILQESISLML